MLASSLARPARSLARPLSAAVGPAAVGSAGLDWSSLRFNPVPTTSVVKFEWENGKWDAGTESTTPTVEVHLFSHVLNFGQSIFEGLKAFQTVDGRVCLFNARCNVARLNSGAERMCMPPIPEALFLDGLERTVRANVAFIPPYGTGGSLYVRPILFGHGAEMAIAPAPKFTLAFISTPVGAFFQGALQGKRALVRDDVDRAAPRGTGGFKVAGNYAPDMLVSRGTTERGFDVSLFLDAKTNSFIEEFSVANFIAVAADGTIVTPSSPSVLPSCTRKVVLRLAEELGLKAEERPIPWDEVKSLKEAAACGTAVVLTPMKSITRGDEEVSFGSYATIQRLYDTVVEIQTGLRPDTLGLLHEVKL